ncbi:UNVERIFIED_ORG: hypothetical protein B5F06_15055 [Lacrimispora saccharolytica]|uniref:hypothetical protein n=1 Tax=Clostridium sp. AM29-11AC TaxID=2293028 RepID=UPI000B376B2E|nr:hypothetical protein [Clostridium sp. AM29-11AC]MBS5389175.1 hypothetical protein [Clostridiales bacterium]RHT57143.1 hypothetical protein DW757_08285 [Clostridium sp. AM29-11AC]
MTKPREKTREELTAEIEEGKKKIRQFENREKIIKQKLSIADGKELASEDIVKAAAQAGISERTVKNARRNLDTQIEVIRWGNQWYYRRNEAKSAK